MQKNYMIAAMLCGFTALSVAQTRTTVVRFVVPFPAGNPLDSTARALAEQVAADFGQPVVVENRAGASGGIAAVNLTSGKDPHAFLFGTTALISITPYLMKTAYAPSDFTPIAKAVHINTVVSVPSGFPAKNWNEFVALAKRDPGKYSYATPGLGTIIHLSMEQLQAAAGIRLLHVPYRDTNAAVQDFIGGRIDVYSEPAVIQFVQNGKAQALGVVSNARLPELPDVPALSELGVPIRFQAWLGLLAPKSVDPELADRIERSVKKVVLSAEFKARLLPGLTPAFVDRAGFARQIEGEQAAYKKLITDLNIKLD